MHNNVNDTVYAGDDTEVTPVGWPGVVLDRFKAEPGLMCLLLHDKADPGYPSFPVLRSSHMNTFGDLLPEIFVNQGIKCLCLSPPALFYTYPFLNMTQLYYLNSTAFVVSLKMNYLLVCFYPSAGGDPFLADLYRRVGGLEICSEVKVWNKVRTQLSVLLIYLQYKIV